MFLGILVAFLLAEGCLRFLVVGWHSSDAPVREVRQYEEGMAAAHFRPDGITMYGDRLTGNPPIPGAPSVVLLGDSFVVAESVEDQQTMGSVLERTARQAGRPLNVHQYGWYHTSVPTYLATAEWLMRQWRPLRVVVLVNSGDFGAEATETGWFWRMKVNPDLSIQLIDVREKPQSGWLEDLQLAAGKSSLALAVRRRTATILSLMDFGHPKGHAGPVNDQSERLPLASVRALKAAFGDALLIVYSPSCDLPADVSPEPAEAGVLAACAQEKVDCVSTRNDTMAVRAEGHMTRGFHNTAPGDGHFNERGHRMVGEVMWREISKGLGGD